MPRPKNPPKPVDPYAELKPALLNLAKEALKIAGKAIPPGGHVSLVAFHDHLDAIIFTSVEEQRETGKSTVLQVWAYPEAVSKYHDIDIL